MGFFQENQKAKIIQKHCGKLMNLYDYGKEKEWIEKIK